MKSFKICILFILVLCLPGAAFAENQLEITFFNVGAGDCILLRQGGAAMMIDTGYRETAPEVISKLNEMGVENIDCMLLTHGDKDHIGGAAAILNSFYVGKIYFPHEKVNTPQYEEFAAAAEDADITPTILSRDVSFFVGSMLVTLYAPKKYIGMVPNDYSVIASVRFGSNKFLFMADATSRRMEDFLPLCACRYDLMKLPHHGYFLRESAPFKKLLSAARPKIGVVTDGKIHPVGRDLALMLEIYRVKVYETKNGDVTVTSDGNSVEVSQSEDM